MTAAAVSAKAKSAVSAVKSIEWSQVKRNTILVAWLLMGLTAFSAPIIQWSVHKKDYYSKVGYLVEYEQQQEQQNNNGNDDGDDAYGGVYRDCSWWNLVCKKQQASYASYYMGDNNDQGNQYDEDGNAVYNFQLPSWYIAIGGGENSEEVRRWKEENTGERMEDDEETSPTTGEILVLTYMYLTLVGILGFGFYTFYQKKPLAPLKIGIWFLVQLIIVNVLLIPKLISSEDRMWDESIYGWYGQVGVLMAYFDFWVGIFCISFLVLLHIQDKKGSGSSTEQGTDSDEENGYQLA